MRIRQVKSLAGGETLAEPVITTERENASIINIVVINIFGPKPDVSR